VKVDPSLVWGKKKESRLGGKETICREKGRGRKEKKGKKRKR